MTNGVDQTVSAVASVIWKASAVTITDVPAFTSDKGFVPSAASQHYQEGGNVNSAEASTLYGSRFTT
jgi:hypothetical protein